MSAAKIITSSLKQQGVMVQNPRGFFGFTTLPKPPKCLVGIQQTGEGDVSAEILYPEQEKTYLQAQEMPEWMEYIAFTRLARACWLALRKQPFDGSTNLGKVECIPDKDVKIYFFEPESQYFAFTKDCVSVR